MIGAARFSCILGLVERPLALALGAGLLTGDWNIAVPIGIFLELLWLDVVSMGSIIHPFAGLAFLLLFPICSELGWSQPPGLVLPVVLAIGASYLGSLLEMRFRMRENRYLEAAARWCRPEHDDCEILPEAVIHRSILARALWHAALYVVFYVVIASLVYFLRTVGLYPRLPGLTWPMVWAAAACGAVLSLRTRNAYAILGGTIFAGGALIYLVRMGIL